MLIGRRVDEGLDELERALRRGVRLVAVSAVQYKTGLRMPLGEIARRLGIAEDAAIFFGRDAEIREVAAYKLMLVGLAGGEGDVGDLGAVGLVQHVHLPRVGLDLGGGEDVGALRDLHVAKDQVGLGGEGVGRLADGKPGVVAPVGAQQAAQQPRTDSTRCRRSGRSPRKPQPRTARPSTGPTGAC